MSRNAVRKDSNHQQFKEGKNAENLGLKGNETYDILGIKNITPGEELTVVAKDEK